MTQLCVSAFLSVLQRRVLSLPEGKDSLGLLYRIPSSSRPVIGCLGGTEPSSIVAGPLLLPLQTSTPASSWTNGDLDKLSQWQWTSRREGADTCEETASRTRTAQDGLFQMLRNVAFRRTGVWVDQKEDRWLSEKQQRTFQTEEAASTLARGEKEV